MISRRFRHLLTHPRTENLPLALALQGAGWALLAFFVTVPALDLVPERNSVGGVTAADTEARRIADVQVPTDLLREQLPLPRWSEPREPASRPDTVASEEQSRDPVSVPALDALRVDALTVQAPTVTQAALALPEPPDRLVPGTISTRAFGEGEGRPGRVGGGGGWGGFGPGAMGEGPRCHPRRPGDLRDPRNPIYGTPRVVGGQLY